MANAIPVVLIPGLNCSARLYADQVPALWRFGPVVIADHTRDDTIAGITRRILAAAPPRFALVGLSMGGYIAFDIMRRAADRVVKLALLDTAASGERPEQTERRRPLIALAEGGRFVEVAPIQFPLLVHRARHTDAMMKTLVTMMAEDTGPEAFVRQQKAVMGRIDSRPGLASISCPTLVLVGDGDELTPPAAAKEIADSIAGSRLIVVPECGHLSTIERREAVTTALVEWMEK